MKTFKTYLVENEITDKDIQIITEGLQEEWTPELEIHSKELEILSLWSRVPLRQLLVALARARAMRAQTSSHT